MELRKAVWILLIFLFSNKVLCMSDAEVSNETRNEETKSSNNQDESTTELEPEVTNPIKNPPSNATVIKINSNETEYEMSNVTENYNDVIPKELEDLQPTNSSNFAYVYDNQKSNNSKKDTEALDMLKKVPAASVDYDLAPDQPDIVYKPDDPVDTQIILKDDSINLNFEGMKPFEDDTINTKSLDHVAIVPGTIAAILAGVFLAISIAGYISLLSWRRYLENRYGNRDMLIEDDYCEKNINDLEHFSI